MTADAGKPQLSPTAMSVADTGRVLSKLWRQPITEDMLQADLADGAPRNPDGTINLVHYAAWLVKEMSGNAGA